MIQDGLSLPKRPRSLFNKMAFNCFKDFIKNSPWANYSQCFPATIYPASTCQLVTLPGPGSFPLCVPHPSVCAPSMLLSLCSSASPYICPHPCSSQCLPPLPSFPSLFLHLPLSLFIPFPLHTLLLSVILSPSLKQSFCYLGSPFILSAFREVFSNSE